MPRSKRPAEHESRRAAFILERIYLLLERYLNAVEINLERGGLDQPQNRERDARMLNALARTLEKLFALEQIFRGHKPGNKTGNGSESLQEQIERRISALLDAAGPKPISQKSNQ